MSILQSDFQRAEHAVGNDRSLKARQKRRSGMDLRVERTKANAISSIRALPLSSKGITADIRRT